MDMAETRTLGSYEAALEREADLLHDFASIAEIIGLNPDVATREDVIRIIRDWRERSRESPERTDAPAERSALLAAASDLEFVASGGQCAPDTLYAHANALRDLARSLIEPSTQRTDTELLDHFEERLIASCGRSFILGPDADGRHLNVDGWHGGADVRTILAADLAASRTIERDNAESV
jgi:hypothetical protein